MHEKINIEDLRNKDVNAFKELFNEKFHHIRRFAAKIIKNEDDAKDIASESFIKCWVHTDTFQSINQVTSFLYTTTKWKCLDYLDKKKAESNYQNYLSNLPPDKVDQTLQRLECESLMFEMLYAELVREVETLPKQAREVFKMVYFQNVPRPEVANKLQISVLTVNYHLSTAMKKLRLIFSEKDLALISLVFIGYNQN